MVADGWSQTLQCNKRIFLRGSWIVVLQSLPKKILKLAYETRQGNVKTKLFLQTRFFGSDEATETMVKNFQACVVN